MEERFDGITDQKKEISESILSITDSHPYYTQQLAFTVWELFNRSWQGTDIVGMASDEIVQSHDNDNERFWNSFNRTDMMILTGIASGNISPLSEEFSRTFGSGASSTVFSALQRLTGKGILIKEGSAYYIDDPFFKKWIIMRRQS